ncbi:MAG: homogentisate 1,2-dioxygenase [Candidatus Promineifilaceae bacterium]
MGIHGFAGIQSILYHVHPPTQIRRVTLHTDVAIAYEESGPLRPRHLRTDGIQEGGDLIGGRIPLMGNNEVVLYVARPTEPMSYWYKFAHGDDILFIHEGRGLLESQFGTMPYGPGDYLVIPTGVIWRFIPEEGVPQRVLNVEANGHVVPPKRYLNNYGQFLEHSPYCERDIRPPSEMITIDKPGEFEVHVKARNQVTSFIYDHHLLDVVGWDGHLWPFAFNLADFEPITGRLHQPPPVHQTFDGPGFVLCSFVLGYSTIIRRRFLFHIIIRT